MLHNELVVTCGHTHLAPSTRFRNQQQHARRTTHDARHQQHTPTTHTNNQQPTTNTPWPFWLKVAHAQIEKCIQVSWSSLWESASHVKRLRCPTLLPRRSWCSSRLQQLRHISVSLQRLLIHSSRFPMAPRVEKASRLRQVLCRDAVLWTKPGTFLTCKWSGSCALLWRAWGRSGGGRGGERNCCLSRALQSCPGHGHTVTLLGLLAGGTWPDSSDGAAL